MRFFAMNPMTTIVKQRSTIVIDGRPVEVEGVKVEFKEVPGTEFSIFDTERIQNRGQKKMAEDRLENKDGFGSRLYGGDPYGKDREAFDNREKVIRTDRIYKGDPIAETDNAEYRAVLREVKMLDGDFGNLNHSEREELYRAEENLAKLEEKIEGTEVREKRLFGKIDEVPEPKPEPRKKKGLKHQQGAITTE